MPTSDPFAPIDDAPPLDRGVHHGISFPAYAAQRLMNFGCLKWGKVSMRHMLAAFNRELDDTDSNARKFGRMAHMALLEPERYAREAMIASPCSGVLKSGERKGEACGLAGQCNVDADWYCGRHAPKTAYWPRDFVSQEEAARIARMSDASPLRGIDFGVGQPEVTIVAEVQAVPCKIRVDWLTENHVIDFKKCQVGKATVEECERSIVAYDWHLQAALYQEVAWEATHQKREYLWVFLEDGPPYDVTVIQHDSESYQIASGEVFRLLDQWRAAHATGEFPGATSGIIQGGLPVYLRDRYAAEAFEEARP